MWKMFDNIYAFECTECGTFAEQPPKFNLPPPPLPPMLTEHNQKYCKNHAEKVVAKNNHVAAANAAAWDIDMCDAIPSFDSGNFYSNQSLQTTAMIAVLSLLIVLVALISSLFLWKNKRKMQLLVQCKARNPHGANGGLPLSTVHPYEDPESYFGQLRPLVFQHQHPVDMLSHFHKQQRQHYPSGYPMTHSPPFLISSSPGPDPYCSNDNVYEELTIVHDTDDDETEAPSHSEDDFAGDELSYTEEPAYKQDSAQTTAAAISNIYCDAYALSEPLVQGATHSHAPASTSAAAAFGNMPESNTATRDGILAGMLRQVARKKYETTTGARRKLSGRNARVADVMPQPMLSTVNVHTVRTLPMHMNDNHCGGSRRLAAQQQQPSTSYHQHSYRQQQLRPHFVESSYDYAHVPAIRQSQSNPTSPRYQQAASSSQQQTPIYQARAQDLSFGSDSGYSQYTPTSSIGHNEDDVSVRIERKSSRSRRASRTAFMKETLALEQIMPKTCELEPASSTQRTT